MATSDVTTHVFETSSVFATSMDHMIRFHATSGPKQLTPPPIFVQVKRDTRTPASLTDGELEMVMWMGPVPVRWLARHEDGPSPTSFADCQIEGPMGYWRHEHIFTEAAGGIKLTDRITLGHRPGWRGWLTRLVYDGVPLRILFIYRHLLTRWALSRMK